MKQTNRGTLRRGYNRIVTCACCGHKTQSQIGSGTDLCQECYDFGGEFNGWLDGSYPASEIQAIPTRCPSCIAQYKEAVAKKNN